MASLKNIKLKVQSFNKTGKVTHAMEAVSAVKMRKTQQQALGARTYAATALSLLERFAQTVEASQHPLLHRRADGMTALIVITSDKGLAGAFNSSILKKLEEDIVSRGLTQENTRIIAIGRRGAEYFKNRNYDVSVRIENLSDDVSQDDTRTIAEKVLNWYSTGQVNEVILAYTNFVSTFEQEALVREIMPIHTETIREMVRGIRPVRGKYAGIDHDFEDMAINYTIEPSPEQVVEMLLPRLVTIALFHALLESKASEHSARMVAMKSATDKAHEMAKSLTRVFNKIRQASITREVSEITSGMEAMK